MIALERLFNSQPLPPLFSLFILSTSLPSLFIFPPSPTPPPPLYIFFLPLFSLLSSLHFPLLLHICLPCALFSLVSFSSRVFTQLLLPWLESLPQLLVDLGQSTPPLSAFIIDTLASAAPNMSLTQLEQHLLTLLGMGMC